MSERLRLKYNPNIDYDSLPPVQKEIIQALIDLGGEATEQEIYAQVTKNGRFIIDEEGNIFTVPEKPVIQ